MSNVLSPGGYRAADTHLRDKNGARLFELYSPAGELVDTYAGIALEAVLDRMLAEIGCREG